MIREKISSVTRFFYDLLRVFVLMIIVGGWLYYVDPANAVVFQAMGIALFLVGGTHLTRRFLFNRIDLQEVARTAVNDKNMPAAIIFMSIIGFLVAVMMLSMQVFK